MGNTKNYFKLGILFLGIYISTTSCQKDDELIVVDESAVQIEPELKATVSNFETQLKGNTSAKNKLSKFNGSKYHSRTIHSNTYNFSIDTTRVQKIITEYYTSFTFVVERDQINLDVIENYVLTQYIDGAFTQYLISYPIVNGDPDILTGTIEFINDNSLLYAKEPYCESLFEYVGPVCNDILCTAGGSHTVSDGFKTPDNPLGCEAYGTTSGATIECTTGGWIDTSNCSGGGSPGGDTPPDSTIDGINNGDGTTGEIVVVPLEPDTIGSFKRRMGLASDSPESMWLDELQNLLRINGIDDFLDDGGSDIFVLDAIHFMMINSNVSFSEYENWFSTDYPELESITLNINPDDITYDTPLTQQLLPSLSSYLDAFPKVGTQGNYSQMSSTNVYSLAGGSLLTSHNANPSAYSNACSIRGSRGLLYSGIDIPVLNYNGSQRTQKGGDNKNYILDAVSFDKYMQDKFGDATHELTGAAANDPQQVANMLDSKNGIYVIVNNSSGQAGYSGHVDTIINGECIGGAYTNPDGGVKSIKIWVLN